MRVGRDAEASPAAEAMRLADACVVAQWRLMRGEVNGVARIVSMLRGAAAPRVVAVGEREHAVFVLRQYLALRESPEERVRPQVESVRAEVARLEQESKAHAGDRRAYTAGKHALIRDILAAGATPGPG